MFEEIKQHNALVRDQIYKGFAGGEELLEKAHNEGDIHPNGKWVWTKLPSGKYDWRVMKTDKQAQQSKKQTDKFSIESLKNAIKTVGSNKITVNSGSSNSMTNAMKTMFSHFDLKNSVSVSWESTGFAGKYNFFVDGKLVQGYKVFGVDRKMGYANFTDCVNDCIAHAVIKNNKLKGKEAETVEDMFDTFSSDAPKWNIKE